MLFLEKLSVIGLKILSVVTAIIAVVVIGISAYSLADMWSTEENAFVSHDLLQYRPNVENGEEVSFEELHKKNEDVRAWLTIYNTNIDYPVLQGKDDSEYINKNAYGHTTPTGSIYLTYHNNRDFSDNYNIMYGHNISNGAMFGDILKYLERAYFDGHRKGILITEKQVYDVNIISVLDTDAYDRMVYTVGGDRNLAEIINYFSQNGKYFVNPGSVKKLLVLSTCYESPTNGRCVLLAELSKHEGPYEPYEITDDKIPLGWLHRDNYWAFLNLLCLLATVYLVIPVHIIRSKFKRFKNNLNEDDEEGDKEGDSDENAPENAENEPDEVNAEDVEKKDWYKSRKAKMTVGIIIEIILGILSIIAFILTEDVRLPIQMIDRWTPLMLIILIGTYLIDRFLLRRPKAKNDEEEAAEVSENNDMNQEPSQE